MIQRKQQNKKRYRLKYLAKNDFHQVSTKLCACWSREHSVWNVLTNTHPSACGAQAGASGLRNEMPFICIADPRGALLNHVCSLDNLNTLLFVGQNGGCLLPRRQVTYQTHRRRSFNNQRNGWSWQLDTSIVFLTKQEVWNKFEHGFVMQDIKYI